MATKLNSDINPEMKRKTRPFEVSDFCPENLRSKFQKLTEIV